ncbi:MAG: fibro-slime domain-containing protein [Planctomycetota bacterium]|jgi:fibro-slime domain-containing protein
MTMRRLTAVCAVCLLLGVVWLTRRVQVAGADSISDDPPETISLSGIVRDFKPSTLDGGHPDFGNRPDIGFGRYSGNIASALGADGKPVFTGEGGKIAQEWRDSEHRQICYTLYDESLGDTQGSYATPSTGGITSPASFEQWYRDVPGVNMSEPLVIDLVRQPDGTYVFDDKLDPEYASRGGFFPIDDRLFGNLGGHRDHNYHFTFELHGEFVYDATASQFFKFTGDDDVWVFVDGRLVIDLGGVHAAHDQYFDANRLGLTNGETYRLDLFFAERSRGQSNFRITTNLPLVSLDLPTVSAVFD